jgi:hypothetical protein
VVAISSSNQGSGHDINGHNIADALVPKFMERLKSVQKELAQEQANLGNVGTELETIYQSGVAGCNLKQAQVASKKPVVHQ